MTKSASTSGDGLKDDDRPENSGPPVDSLASGDWGTTADDILVESSFDEDLGKQMSRDAIRASRGEMSEEAFYEKYHRDVLAEFGVDKRPIQTGENDD